MNEAGIPIYLDDKTRHIVDSLATRFEPHDLYPSNTATQKLHACIEALRDILPLLESISTTTATDKRRRKLKVLFTPVYSLVFNLLRLMRDIQNNPHTRQGPNDDLRQLVAQMEQRFSAVVPHGKEQILRTIRDSLSAHIDDRVDPSRAQDLFSRADTSQMGLWMHCCAAVLVDLMKLPIYVWSCSTQQPTVFGLTSIDLPLMMTFFETEGGKLKSIAGAVMLKRDPRTDVFELINELISSTKWMFGSNDPHIHEFKEDPPGTHWAQSLHMLQSLQDFQQGAGGYSSPGAGSPSPQR